MVGMVRHSLHAAMPRLEDRVMSHSGTNGYVSTWGDAFAGCQPPAPVG